MLRYTTYRARPGLVALYDIRPGNGARANSYSGVFRISQRGALQPTLPPTSPLPSLPLTPPLPSTPLPLEVGPLKSS